MRSNNVVLKSAPSAEGWSRDAVGEMKQIDWEKYQMASGAVEESGTITVTVTVTGTGDIGLGGAEGGGRPVERTLGGLTLGLLIVLVVAVRFVTSEYRRMPARAGPVTRRVLAAQVVVVGAVTFVTGLLAVGIVIPVGVAILKRNGRTEFLPWAMVDGADRMIPSVWFRVSARVGQLVAVNLPWSRLRRLLVRGKSLICSQDDH